jgi:hypothetical protein
MTVRRFVAALALLAISAVPARAQRIEASIEAGYTFSEGIKASDPVVINGVLYDELAVTSGASWGFTFGVFVTPAVEIEFLYNRQLSEFQAEGPITELKLSDVNVDNYHFNFVYNWGEGGRIIPFAFGGLGMTRYDPGERSAEIPGDRQIDGETRFSSTWGGGIKMYAGSVGLRVTGRWTPTYIKSETEGIWCDPWYGVCWAVADLDYSQQFEFAGGITFRF